MKSLATRMQQAGIAFTEASASHVGDCMHIKSIVLASDADLMKFAAWSAENDVNFDSARVATAAELKASQEMS